MSSLLIVPTALAKPHLVAPNGYVLLSCHADDSKAQSLLSFPEQRWLGLAWAAMAIVTLHADGERQVALTVATGNGPALALFRALGSEEADGA